MLLSYRRGAVVPFEDHYGVKQIVVTDSGTVAVLGREQDGGWWIATPDNYDQGPAGVSMEELRARVEAVRSVIASSGLPNDNITAFAVAVVGLDAAGWDDFNANDFHKGVAALSPHVLANAERGTTTIYEADGTRISDAVLERRRDELRP